MASKHLNKQYLHEVDADINSEDVLLLVNKEIKKRNLGSLYLKGFTAQLPDIFNAPDAVNPAANVFTTSLATQAKRHVFAAPLAASGTPSFRALQLADISDYSQANVNYWTKTGNDLNYNAGKVRIGTFTDSGAFLTVNDSINLKGSNPYFQINNSFRSFAIFTQGTTAANTKLIFAGENGIKHLEFDADGFTLFGNITRSGSFKNQFEGSIRLAGVANAILKTNAIGEVIPATLGTDYINSINSQMVTNALGYTPFNAANYVDNHWIKTGNDLSYGDNTTVDRIVSVKAGTGGTGSATFRMGTITKEWDIKTNSSPYSLSFNYVGTNAPLSNILTLNTNGNVGIGIATPSKQLMLYGSDPWIRIQENSASGKRLDLWVDSTTAIAYIGANQSGQQLSFQTTNSDRLFINSIGKVGIGTTSFLGTAIFQVNGTARLSTVTNSLLKTDSIGEISGATAADITSLLGTGNYIQNQYSAAQSGSLWVSGIVRGDNFVKSSRRGFFGTYVSTEVQGIWSINEVYRIDETNNNFGIQYGFVYARTNAESALADGTTKLPITSWGHQYGITEAGMLRHSFSGGTGHVWHLGTVFLGDYSDSSNNTRLILSPTSNSVIPNQLILGKLGTGGTLTLRRPADGASAGALFFENNNRLKLFAYGGGSELMFNASNLDSMLLNSSGNLILSNSTTGFGLLGNYKLQVNGAGFFNSTVTITPDTTTKELLRFNTERPWRFVADGTGSATALHLQDFSGAKWFKIVGLDSTPMASFYYTTSSNTGFIRLGDSTNIKIYIGNVGNVSDNSAFYNFQVTGAAFFNGSIRQNQFSNSIVKASPNGTFEAATSQDVIDVLGYTPYNSANPSGFITIGALNPYATTTAVNSLLNSYVPTNRNITINGVTQDLSQNRSWNIALPSGSKWSDGTNGSIFKNEHVGIGGAALTTTNNFYIQSKLQVYGNAIFGESSGSLNFARIMPTSFSISRTTGHTLGFEIDTTTGRMGIAGYTGDIHLANGNLSGTNNTGNIAIGQSTGKIYIGNIAGTSFAQAAKVFIDSGAANGAGLYVKGTITSTDNIFSLSDTRLKSNIQILGNISEQLSKVIPISYLFNNRNDIGFSAQNIQEIFPQLVRKQENGFLSVNYNAMVAINTAAINSQAAKLSKHELRIIELENEVAELKRRYA